jgi:hypothetical protein
MFRWRQRNTASGGEDAGARPGRDSHQPEGLPEGSREAKGTEAQGRKASRVMLPRMLAKTLEGSEAQEGIGRRAALNEVCMRYGSTAGARP